MSRPNFVKRQIERSFLKFKTLILISFFAISGLTSVSAQAEIRVLAAGGGLLGAPYATEEIIANGDVVGTVDRPTWSVFRELTTADIIANYDVFVIPWNTDPALYDFDWDTNGGTASSLVPDDSTQIGLGIGEYWFEVDDVLGCYFSDTITITQPDTIEVTPLIVDASCAALNRSDGSIHVTPINHKTMP